MNGSEQREHCPRLGAGWKVFAGQLERAERITQIKAWRVGVLGK